MAEPDATPLRRNRSYQLLWSAHALSAFGSQASAIALPLVLLAATGSAADFGIVTFAEITASALAGLPAGLVADRLARRTVLIACDLGRAVTYALFTLAVLAHRVDLPVALAAAIVNSALSAPFPPAAAASLRQLVPAEQLGTALSLSQARAAAATLAGPMLGVALYAVAPALPFLADVLSYVLSAALVAAARLPRTAPARTADAPAAAVRPPGAARRFTADLTAGVREVRRSPFLRYTLLNAAVVNVAFGGIVLTLMTEGATGPGGGLHNGVLIAMSGAGNLVGSLLAARLTRTVPPRLLVLAVCWSTALLTPLLALHAGLALSAVAIGLSCVATPPANAVISATRLHSVPDELAGRVQAACGLLPALVIPFGPLVCGLLLAHFSAAAVLLGNAGLLAALAVVSTTSSGLRHIPDLRPAARPQPSPLRRHRAEQRARA
jgi:MFS family permease